jgi:predicted NAD-dependent protein-ADP-ribosyltransferase YbiA (DUF1768 family)
MVKSKLDDTINYPEFKKINEDDVNFDATLYEVPILNKKVIIALGKSKYTFIDKNIEYFPIYLVKNNKVVSQIGVYETFSSEVPNILDEDGDVDIDLLNSPLIFSFIEKDNSLLERNRVKTHEKIEYYETESDKTEEDDGFDELEREEPLLEEEKSEDEISIEEEKIDENDSEDEEGFEKKLKFSELKEQTKEDMKRENDEFILKKESEWIESFFKSNHYDLIDNEGQGDCFFAVIRDGLARAGVKTSVQELRNKLSESIDENVFRGYLEMYTMYSNELKSIKDKMLIIVEDQKKLKKELDKTIDKKRQLAIIENGKLNSQKHKELEKDKLITENLISEFSSMKGIDTIEKFRELVKSCKFWADTWAISTIERLANIKIILFSEESYINGDADNVLNCGQLNDTILQSRGIFEPDYYIMANYSGNHYKLITYKSRGALTFKELPYAVKELIVNKCLEKNAGPYYIIPDFKNLKGDLEIPVEIELGVEEINELPLKHLWDEDTIFQFYYKSNSKPLPGKGTGEKIGQEGVKSYSQLSSILDWRKKLSNQWISEFTLDGHRWNSVEHYYQGSKFKKENPQFYLTFSLDSNTELSKDPLMASAAGDNGKYEGNIVRPKTIKVDKDFSQRENYEMKIALQSKFNQNQELKTLLINTKRAKLIHFRRGQTPETATLLMELREDLQKH